MTQVIVCLKNQFDTIEKEKRVLNDIIDKLELNEEEMQNKIKELTAENNKLTSLSFNNVSKGKNGGKMVESSYELTEIISENGEVFWKRFRKMIKF